MRISLVNNDILEDDYSEEGGTCRRKPKFRQTLIGRSGVLSCRPVR